MELTIEQKVATAILEKPLATIDLAGHTYEIAQPSIATLILASEIISTLPTLGTVDPDSVFYTVIEKAKDFRAIGDLCAVLVLGAKNLKEEREEVVTKKRFFGLLTTYKKRIVTIDKKAELADIILNNLKPATILNVIIQRLKELDIVSFFAITTSLNAANILKPTKETTQEVVDVTTASGQPSSE